MFGYILCLVNFISFCSLIYCSPYFPFILYPYIYILVFSLILITGYCLFILGWCFRKLWFILYPKSCHYILATSLFPLNQQHYGWSQLSQSVHAPSILWSYFFYTSSIYSFCTTSILLLLFWALISPIFLISISNHLTPTISSYFTCTASLHWFMILSQYTFIFLIITILIILRYYKPNT